jgi:hypothetical protein
MINRKGLLKIMDYIIMTKNPIYNAIAAEVYILLVASVMRFIIKQNSGKPDTFFDPIVILSLLTLSVAVMGYIFFLKPVLMYIDGEKKEAITLLLQTILSFAVITIIAVGIILLGF